MTPLRQRMIDAMVLRGFAARTQETYLSAVGQAARHHHCSPALLTDEQVQTYLLYLLQERQRSRSTVNITSCALRFLVCDVLGQDQRRAQIPMGRNPQRLPEVLSRAEVAALLAAPLSPKARMFLTLAYASGLRLSELCQLRGCDIDSAPDRMCIRVIQGKGAQDRYALLTAELLADLRPARSLGIGSVGGKVATILRGEADLYLSLSGRSAPKDWDMAAPEAVLVAAGGAFSHADGRPLLYNSGDVRQAGCLIASHGPAHADLCRRAAAAMAVIDPGFPV